MTTLSRHRLPEPYRSLLCGLWLTPPILLFLTLLRLGAAPLDVLHPFTVLALLLMALPAWYVWREGVDVTDRALVIRMGGWRQRTYAQLDTFTLHEPRPGTPVLTVWDTHRRRVIHTPAAHLSDLPLLLRALKTRLRAHSVKYDS